MVLPQGLPPRQNHSVANPRQHVNTDDLHVDVPIFTVFFGVSGFGSRLTYQSFGSRQGGGFRRSFGVLDLATLQRETKNT